MASLAAEIFRERFRPLAPIPTGEKPVLRPLSGIRAVLFDVYGTLFISDSGEVGNARQAACEEALAEALRAMDVPMAAQPSVGMAHFFGAIKASHAESRQAGIDYPEVDILRIWRQVLDILAEHHAIDPTAGRQIDVERLAVEYEVRANPCWPMPHLPECLRALRDAGLVLGIVSNAQFFTPALFEALLGESAEHWGFDPRLQYYSYRYNRAKPGTAMYEMAVAELEKRRIMPAETLYVGNDMLNDVFPAQKVSLRTALFAGDARSLRLRPEDARIEGILPDLVLTDLSQLSECTIIK